MIMEETQTPGNNEQQEVEEQEQKPYVVASSPSPNDKQDEKIANNDDYNKQIVLYNPPKNQPSENAVINQEIVPVSVSNPVSEPVPVMQPRPRVLPSVGAFTVQCAVCFKWRLIPSKELYEEIREHILENPFTCVLAKQWRPEISCDDPTDIEQDGNRVWAIDKPNIAKPPPGWDRELRIRAEGGSKFADVYYTSPTGKRLRSMVEVQKFLMDHPEFIQQGVALSQFSFQIPKPLQADYVRKRPTRLTAPCDPVQVNPISWAAPDDGTILQLWGPDFSSSYTRGAPTDVVNPPANKKSRPSKNHMFSSDPSHMQQHRFKINGPRPPPNGFHDF